MLIVAGILFVLAVAIHIYNIWKCRSINSHPEFEQIDSDIIARFPLNETCTLVSISGEPLNFDMGSRHSFISWSAVRKMQSMNYPVKISKMLIYTKDNDGYYHWYNTLATLDVVLPNPELPDSVYHIRNVELIVSDDINANVLGMDLMKYMAIEHKYDTNELIIYRKAPEDGYHMVSDITVYDSRMSSFFGEFDRASVTLTVNNDDPREYFLDTGGLMRKYELVQPEDCMTSANGVTMRDEETGLMVQKNCRVSFGDRVRFSTVIYSDSLHTDKYSVNPLNLFDQDCVIDFIGKRLLIRQTKAAK